MRAPIMTIPDYRSMDGYVEAEAELSRVDVRIHTISGFCPVQAEGEVDGQPLYFRARGDCWSLEIGPREQWQTGDCWWTKELYGKGAFDAGYMTLPEALRLIALAICKYRKNKRPAPHRVR